MEEHNDEHLGNGARYVTYRSFLTIVIAVLVAVLGAPALTIWLVNSSQEERIYREFARVDSELRSIKSDILLIKGDVIQIKIEISENKKELRQLSSRLTSIYEKLSYRQQSQSPKYFRYYGFGGQNTEEDNYDPGQPQ